MKHIALPTRLVLASLMVAAGVAGAQVVLRDVPKTGGGGKAETPRWLGKTNSLSIEERRVIVDRELARIEATNVEFGPDQTRYRDSSGKAQSIATGSILMVLPAEAKPLGTVKGIEWREIADVETGPLGRVEMLDGQVFPGKVVAGAAKTDAIRWEHSLLGVMELPLDGISRLVFKPGTPTVAVNGTSDAIQFTNGDVARGTLEKVEIAEASAIAQVTMDVAGKPFTAGTDRVVSVTLANPPSRAQGVFMWLRDGTVVGSKEAQFATSGLTLSGSLSGSDKPMMIPWDEVVGVNMDAAKVVALSSIAMSEVKPIEGRAWAAEPVVESSGSAQAGVGEVGLSGPIRVRWSLPGGARMVSMVAMLPPSARTMGDCVLVVECGGKTVRQRLHGGEPSVFVRLEPTDPASAGTLTVTIESGEGGSIQDRVVLRRAIVLVK